MSGIGIRCSHKRAKRNSGARSKDQGFTHISLPFVSTFEVPFVGGNNHASGGIYLLSVSFSTCMTKEASGACLPCNTAQHPIAARAARHDDRQGDRHWPSECLLGA